MAALSSSDTDYFVRQLECPVCLVTMKPPIYLCKTGHSICGCCYETVNDCPQCKVSYGKVVQDKFDGNKLMKFICKRGCNVVGRNSYTIRGKNVFTRLVCISCKDKYNVVPYNGELILQTEFMQMQAEFRPPQNYSLEAMTACILYPCEAEQCPSKFKLSEQEEHQSNCIYRTLMCPCSDCEWNGPVSSLYDHFVNTVNEEDDEYLRCHQLAQKNVKFKVCIPSRHQMFCKVYVFKNVDDFPDSIFAFEVDSPPGDGISFRLIHYGTAADGKDINGNVTMYSHHNDSHFRSFSFPVLNDFLRGDHSNDEEMPSADWLRDNHFMDPYRFVTFDVDFFRRKGSNDPDVVLPASLHTNEHGDSGSLNAGTGRKRQHEEVEKANGGARCSRECDSKCSKKE